MPIRPFLFGRAFDPETIDRMSEALEGVCETLNLKLADGPETQLVAQKVIELAQRGVRDVATLRTMTLSEFKYKERVGHSHVLRLRRARRTLPGKAHQE
jgi:hypothetical protein